MSKTMEMEKTAVNENLKLQVRRTIRAPRSRVYEAWIKPERIQQWFGGVERNVQSVIADVRMGGKYRIEMQRSCEGDLSASADIKKADAAPAFIATGNYTEIIPNEKLVFTWTGNWNTAETTLVTVVFLDAANGSGTEVILTHERFATPESMGRHEQGWTAGLEGLVQVCEA